MAHITAAIIKHHWPELIITAKQDVVFCSCGERFAEEPDFVPMDEWASHVASEINAEVRRLAGVPVIEGPVSWEDEHAGPRKPRS